MNLRLMTKSVLVVFLLHETPLVRRHRFLCLPQTGERTGALPNQRAQHKTRCYTREGSYRPQAQESTQSRSFVVQQSVKREEWSTISIWSPVTQTFGGVSRTCLHPHDNSLRVEDDFKNQKCSEYRKSPRTGSRSTDIHNYFNGARAPRQRSLAIRSS